MNHIPEHVLCVHASAACPPTSWRPGGPGRVFALIGVAALLAVCGCKKEAAPPPPPAVVQVLEITPTNVTMFTEIIGQLDSPQNVEVRARVEAFVEQVLFTEGTNVVKGAPLFRLDKKPLEQRLAAAEGMLAEAKAALNKYQADVARLTPLATNRAIPKQDLDNAVASVAVGQANVQSAEARVASAKIDLGYCDVDAPISGLIGAKEVSVGSLVGKGEPTLLATISTLDPIWIYCNVSEVGMLDAEAYVRRTGKRISDAPVSLILANGSVHPHKGKIVFADRAVDVKTGTLRIRARFPNPPVPPNPDPVLRPGMFGRMKVDLGVRPDSLLVPERAVTELQGKNFVWVIGDGDIPAQREVKVGDTFGGSVLIVEGLKAGERVIVEGVQKVRGDVPVQPKTAEQMAEAAAQAAKAAEAKQAEAKSGKEGDAKTGKH